MEKLREEIIDKLHWKEFKFIGQDNAIFEGSLTQESEEYIAAQIDALIRQHLEPPEDRIEAIAQTIYNNYREPYCLVPEWEWTALPIKEEYRKVARQICQIPMKVKLPPENEIGRIFSHYAVSFEVDGRYSEKPYVKEVLELIKESLKKQGIEVE